MKIQRKGQTCLKYFVCYVNQRSSIIKFSECHGSEAGGEVTWTSDAERFKIKNHMNVDKPKPFKVFDNDDINFIEVILFIEVIT